MNNLDMARMNVERAAAILEEAERWFQKKRWNLVIRRSQEAVELALKGALRWAALEVPRWHDVGGLLQGHGERFPDWFRQETDRMADISRELREEREISFYGDEAQGVPPEAMYVQEDAQTALDNARFVVALCQKLTSTVNDTSEEQDSDPETP